VRWQLAEVEAECEALLQQATTVDASSPEPLQVSGPLGSLAPEVRV